MESGSFTSPSKQMDNGVRSFFGTMMSTVHEPAITQLNKLGAHLISPAAGSEFLRRLQDLGPQKPSFSVATRVGPFGKAFVLPDQVISASEQNRQDMVR